MSWYCDALSRPTTLQAVQIDRLPEIYGFCCYTARLLCPCLHLAPLRQRPPRRRLDSCPPLATHAAMHSNSRMTSKEPRCWCVFRAKCFSPILGQTCSFVQPRRMKFIIVNNARAHSRIHKTATTRRLCSSELC